MGVRNNSAPRLLRTPHVHNTRIPLGAIDSIPKSTEGRIEFE
jgi:hypothetical protein